MATGNNSSSGVRIPLRDLDVKFIPQCLIGEGGFGRVYRAKYRDKHVAFKIPIEKASLPPNKRRVVEKEAEKLRASTHHKFIVTLYGVVIEDDPDIKGLVLEYMHFGSLTDFLAEYDVGVPLRIKFLQNILSAMKWLHSNNPPIRHLDLKAENILVNNHFDAKITDFGLSQWKTATTVNLSARNGTITHVPPEVFRDINKKGSVEEDVYAFGITAWEIFTGETPFQNCNPNMITNAVVNGQRPDVKKVTQECPQCPKHVVDMMQWCWEHNPVNRPSFQELEIKFVPVYNTIVVHLPVSIRFIRQQIQKEHGCDSEKYKCTQHFETTSNDDNQTGVKDVWPVRNEGPVNGEILHREASLESTPRQDGLETNIERGLGDMSIMTPDGDRRLRLPGDQSQCQEYENNTGDYTNMSGLVSIKGQRYVPGHEIRHTKGYIAQPESTENSVNSNQNAQNHVDRPERLRLGSQGEAGVDIVVSMKTVAAARSESGAAKSQAADGGGIKGAEKRVKDCQDLSAQSKSAEDVFESGTKEMAGNIGDDEAIRKLSDTDPEIADTLLKSPDALKTFMMTRQSSTDVFTGHPLAMEDQPQRLTIHNGEKAVVSSGNTNIGRTTGVISADQQPSSFRDRDQRNQNYPAPVTYSNQTGPPVGLTSEGSQPTPNLMTMYTGVNRPQLNPGNLQNLPQHQPGSYGITNPQRHPGTYPNQPQLLPGTFQNQAQQQQQGAYGASHPQQYGAYGVANQPAPGTFDHNQRPLVQLPNTATRQSSVPSQVQFPPNTHMGSSTNPEEAVNRQVREQSVLQYYNNMTGTSARTRDNTSAAVRMSASTVPTTQPQTVHSNTHSTRQAGNQPHEDRQDSGRNKKSGTTTQSVVTPKPNAIVIQHKHNDGAFTTVNFDGSANMFPNVQIGNTCNMTMNVHRDSATQNIPRNNASSKKRSTECKKSDLTMSDQVPEVDTIDQVSVEVGADWKRLFRQLDISEPEIDQLQYDFHTGGLYEIIYQGLRMWKQKNGSEATVRKLALALWEIERSDIARKLK